MKFRMIVDPKQEELVTARVHAPSTLTEELERLVLQHGATDPIYGYTEDEMRLLVSSELECITVLDGKTYAIDHTGTQYRLKQRLYEVEQLLPDCFIRINKSTLANERQIVKFIATYSGAVDALFRCGYRDYVSRRCLAAIKRRYEA